MTVETVRPAPFRPEVSLLVGLPAIPPTVTIDFFYNYLVARNARAAGEEPFVFRVEEKMISQLYLESLGGWTSGTSPATD